MAKFLVQVSYSVEGAQGLRKDGGTKRLRAVTKAVESVGGRVEAFYFSFGTQDAILIVDGPDNVATAALSLAVAASGAARLSSTPLLTPDEMDRACGKKTAYRAPGK
jgi:uncharacterized protein with GYD domain